MTAPHLTWSTISERYGAVYEHGEPNYRFSDGTVTTPQGIVRIYSEPRHTRMWIVRDGKELAASWERGFRPRYLVTLARRFAAGRFE